jgi:hypothetical protein
MNKMRTYKNKETIKNKLIESLKTGEGIHTKATSMVNGGSHHWWLTGTQDDYVVHCYGSGQGWSDQSDDCTIQDIDEIVSRLWKDRANIIEDREY